MGDATTVCNKENRAGGPCTEFQALWSLACVRDYAMDESLANIALARLHNQFYARKNGLRRRRSGLAMLPKIRKAQPRRHWNTLDPDFSRRG